MNLNNILKIIILIVSFCNLPLLFAGSVGASEKTELCINTQFFDYQGIEENAAEAGGANEQIQICQDQYFNCAGKAGTMSDLMDCQLAHAICCNQVKL